MKKIVHVTVPTEIGLAEPGLYKMGKLYAYKSEGNSGWCFLAKITPESCTTLYGFLAMNYTDTHPRFVSNSIRESLTLCLRKRQPFVFENVFEFAEHILKTQLDG
jgi:hypothetical protein